MKKIVCCFFALTFILNYSQAQVNKDDSLKMRHHKELIFTEKLPTFLSPIQGTNIYSGKKNEVIHLNQLDADLSSNNYRQIMAKVPGVSIWESDGSGIQTSVSTRGLSPNRSWEFNVRQNGVDISSEVFGYPEAYFTPPTEALEKIEIVRGAGSLQYGPQFGGMMNYVTKRYLGTKPFSFESQQTIGNYGMYNAFNAIGGKIKKFSYYGYLHHRSADGWRQNSQYRTTTGHISLSYSFSPKLNATLEYTHMDYKSQQPGGLTDSMFLENAQQSNRARNWIGTPWNTAALHLDYSFNDKVKIGLKIFYTNAQRNSIGFLKDIYVPDSLNGSFYNNRQVDRDWYNNIGGELRFLQKYNLLGNESALSAGIRVYSGETTRKQGGIGSVNSDFDLEIVSRQTSNLGSFDYKRELNFTTRNGAAFIENMFQLTKRLSITPGVRLEYINSGAFGAIDKPFVGTSIAVPNQVRTILLAGVGAEFKATKNSNVYANFSQAYRPVTYSELTPAATTDSIDSNLKDASGYNIDFGYRGTIKEFLTFDVGAFYLFYDNRVGTINVNNKNLRTNIGASVSKGIESFVELDVMRIFSEKSKIGNLKLYANIALIDARYIRWDDPAALIDSTKDFTGNYVENSPRTINRFGLTYKYNRFSLNFQLNQVGEVYTDALNTELSNARATIGKISGYQVMDVSCTYLINGKYNVKAGVNNLTDERYATRRAGGYPGPGLLPANGRTFYFSIGVKF
ncbi:MAG: TonB-dependent receptor family protein [Crocinitomicaceae bacterium]|jgi:Fe(3+) dicitrate transport protein